jgi:HEPN domain-containing protein
VRDEYLTRWLKMADRDLRVADNELHTLSGDVVTEAVCFHAQQAVEKYLKSFLIAKQVKFPRTHNLEVLQELCGPADPEFSTLDLTRLSYYAVEVRYPDELDEPSLQDAERSLYIARGIRALVHRKLADDSIPG